MELSQAQPDYVQKNKKIRCPWNSGGMRVARGGCGAKALPLAARPGQSQKDSPGFRV